MVAGRPKADGAPPGEPLRGPGEPPATGTAEPVELGHERQPARHPAFEIVRQPDDVLFKGSDRVVERHEHMFAYGSDGKRCTAEGTGQLLRGAATASGARRTAANCSAEPR
jgi:hypothetical protein